MDEVSMKVGDLVRDIEYNCLFLGIVVHKVPPSYWNDSVDRWFVQWCDGDSYALNACNMEVIS